MRSRSLTAWRCGAWFVARLRRTIALVAKDGKLLANRLDHNIELFVWYRADKIDDLHGAVRELGGGDVSRLGLDQLGLRVTERPDEALYRVRSGLARPALNVANRIFVNARFLSELFGAPALLLAPLPDDVASLEHSRRIPCGQFRSNA